MDALTSIEQDSATVKARLKESYDVMAVVYNEWTTANSPARMVFLRKFLDMFPGATSNEECRLLELGCGAGVPVTETLLTYPHFRLTANDLSSTQIALGKERLGRERIDWREGDMLALDIDEGSFDAVLAFFSMIHLPREEQGQMLDKIVAWLKPGGYFVANFSSEDMPAAIEDKWLHDKGWMYWSGWGADKTREKVKAAGLEVLVADVAKDVVDGSFLWIIARKP